MKKLFAYVVTIFFLLGGTVLAGEQVFYYHTDPAGTPLAMTDANGNVVWRADYKPFGEEQSVTQSPANDMRFVGKEKDKETGLQYFGARYMKDEIGRFITPDPVGPVDPRTSKTNYAMLKNPQNLNRYAYSLNNPYRYLDPNGREVRIVGHVAVPLPFASSSGLGSLKAPPAYHLAIVLIPDNPQDFTNRSGWTEGPNGQISATLGAHEREGNLISTPNYKTDSLSYSTFSQVVQTPVGMTDTQFINRLISAANSYDNSLSYKILPVYGEVGYNSNSYVSGIVEAAGATPPELYTRGTFQTPGYIKPIPLRPQE